MGYLGAADSGEIDQTTFESECTLEGSRKKEGVRLLCFGGRFRGSRRKGDAFEHECFDKPLRSWEAFGCFVLVTDAEESSCLLDLSYELLLDADLAT